MNIVMFVVSQLSRLVTRLKHWLKTLGTKYPAITAKVYTAFVRSLLEHGICGYIPYKRKSILRLERNQNSFTKKVFIRTSD